MNALEIEEVENHRYLCKLIDTLDKNIGKEIDIKIYSNKGVSATHISWENIIWSSLFLSIYSSFESKLNQICLIVMEKDKIELSPKDLRDSGLTRARKYLYNVAKYKLPIPENKWKLSEKYNKVRNTLAHNEGRLDKHDNKKDKDFHNFIKSNSNLKIDNFNKLVITKNFVLEVENFFNDVYLTICKELAIDK